MRQATVKNIGNQAIDPKEELLILFDQEATAELKKVSIVQAFDQKDLAINLKKGDKISFDQAEYTVTYASPLASQSLNEIGHTVMIFKEVPATDRLANAVYLTPFDLPAISEGTIITYH